VGRHAAPLRCARRQPDGRPVIDCGLRSGSGLFETIEADPRPANGVVIRVRRVLFGDLYFREESRPLGRASTRAACEPRAAGGNYRNLPDRLHGALSSARKNVPGPHMPLGLSSPPSDFAAL